MNILKNLKDQNLKMNIKRNDEYYMRLCLKLAKKAEGKTYPNPLVGSLIVKDGIIIGSGYHKGFGMPHAEIEALRSCKTPANGATLYVNLEPCNHFGKTPPCTDAIIKNKIKRVVIGMLDPNPLNNGNGVKKLRDNNVDVRYPVLNGPSESLNKKFKEYISGKLPLVTLKLAQSLDGKIATYSGDSKWISDLTSRVYVHNLRSRSDAVMVGMNTLIKDNPILLNRLFKEGKTHQPARICLGDHTRIPKNSNLFKNTDTSRVFIVSNKPISKKEFLKFKKNNIEFIYIKTKGGHIPLKIALERLKCFGIYKILVEGGSELAASLLNEKLVNKILLFIAPIIIGGKDACSSIGGKGVKFVNKSIKIKHMHVSRIGRDILIKGDI